MVLAVLEWVLEVLEWVLEVLEWDLVACVREALLWDQEDTWGLVAWDPVDLA